MKQIIQNLEKMQFHYNALVKAYEALPDMTPMRKVIIEDALTVIGVTMDGVMHEIMDMIE